MLSAYTDGEQVRLLLRPDLEDLEGWTEVTLPEDYDPEIYRFEAGEFILDLASVESEMRAKIDREAGEFRQNFITEIPGQQLTYDRKEGEARALKAGKPGPFIFLEAEARRTGQTIDQLATEVIINADAWAYLGAEIEGQRVGAKRAVTAATTRADKVAAADINWWALVP